MSTPPFPSKGGSTLQPERERISWPEEPKSPGVDNELGLYKPFDPRKHCKICGRMVTKPEQAACEITKCPK